MNQNIGLKEIINNRFEILSELGEGGFGKVLLVFDNEINEICALKLIRPELTINQEIQDRFKKEALIWMEFEKHQNIVNVRSVDFYNGYLFLALEFIPPNDIGINTLDSLIFKQKIPLEDILKWSVELCVGMNYAISRGLIAHRDLKPSNLMIDANNTLKITDFGLAIFSVDPFNEFIDSSPSGTPAYMPPEQFLEGNIDHRSDIYSFGIILFEMITGHLPFIVEATNPDDYFDYFFKLHSSFKVPIVNNPLFSVIAKCLEKRPENRYQSFQEIYQELQRINFELFGKILEKPTKQEMSIADHNNYALSYFFLGDFNRALLHIEKVLDVIPDFPKALNNKATIEIKLGNYEEATKLWVKMIKTNPDLGRPFHNLANIFMQQGNLDIAIEYFKMAVEKEPYYVPALVNLAICYQHFDIDQAIFYYDTALKIAPNDSQIKYNKGVMLHENGFHNEAIILFCETIEINPNHVSSYNYLGLCFEQLGQFEDSLSCFEKALEINPTYSFPIDNKKRLRGKLMN